jgi:dTMP kinase
MDRHGKLIVFEGPDGVGKSTLVESTKEFLARRSVPFVSISFPGKEPGTLGWLVDQIHHGQRVDDVRELTALSLQAMHIAAHLDHIEVRIRPALQNGTVVILDRFWWSTLVYGRAGTVQPEVLEFLVAAEKAAWGRSLPAVMFLVNRTAPFRPEQDKEGFERLSGLYSGLAAQEQNKYPVVTIANDSIQESMGTIQARLEELL